MPEALRSRPRPRGVLLCGAILLSGCATGGLPGTAVDPVAVVRLAERQNALDGPAHVVFEWRLEEPGLRADGRGVARLEPPQSARLDLFAGNGETVATAALVGSEMRLPPGVPEMIPPPALLWAALGIFKPGGDAVLLGSEVEADGAVHHLRYRLPGDLELRYLLRQGTLSAAELLHEGRTIERVVLEAPLDGELPGAATYRNLTAFRELKVTVESVERVEGFPAEIWHPGR